MPDPEVNELRLRDGRTLAYADYGSRDGLPIIRCHGAPSSRLEGALVAGAADELGVRMIVPDRPGMGRSQFQARRRIDDWPDDVLELADSLGIDRFAVLGVSAGAPYALACAARISSRVRVIGLVSAVAPLHAPGVLPAMNGPSRTMYGLSRHAPWILRGALRLMRRAIRGANRAGERVAASFPEADLRVLQQPGMREHLTAVVQEALRQGARGVVWDMGLVARAWGFELASVATPVLLWQGEQDRNVPTIHGRYLAAAIPNCRATFYGDEGHLSLFVNRQREILRDIMLAAAAAQRTTQSDE